jgi:hypothetical protein
MTKATAARLALEAMARVKTILDGPVLRPKAPPRGLLHGVFVTAEALDVGDSSRLSATG